MFIGQNIRAARRAAGLTQGQLAEKLGCSYTLISQYERGARHPKRETLARIAAALGTTPEQLAGGEGGMPAASESRFVQLGKRVAEGAATAPERAEYHALFAELDRQTQKNVALISALARDVGDDMPQVLEGWKVAYVSAQTVHQQRAEALARDFGRLSPQSQEHILEMVQFFLHKEGKEEG